MAMLVECRGGMYNRAIDQVDGVLHDMQEDGEVFATLKPTPSMYGRALATALLDVWGP